MTYSYILYLLISTKDIQIMKKFKSYMAKIFIMTDLKEIKFFLGINIDRDYSQLSLSQSAYIENSLLKFNMEHCNPVNSPLASKLNHEALNLDDKCNAPSRNLIGCLMYIMLCTKPDLSKSVNLLSRYCEKNKNELW